MAGMYGDRDRERRAQLDVSRHPSEGYRSEFRRDIARLIHCAAFRRQQGKTQVFPGFESDSFRNRLTHSLEVSQIAKSIAIRLNETHEFLREPINKLDIDLIEFAGLCHDIGHPPFGHTGEQALNGQMRAAGGFEGNAQTLRILSKLEKRQKTIEHDTGIDQSGRDCRLGLNLTARSLAAILKYDSEIPFAQVPSGDEKQPKGYYGTESDVVAWVKTCVLGSDVAPAAFKTVECRIMDLADDIAYSTYDLEDALKADFLNPLTIVSLPDDVLDEVATRVQSSTGATFDADNVDEVLRGIFKDLFGIGETIAPMLPADGTDDIRTMVYARVAASASRRAAENGYIRTNLTSDLVGEFIRSVEFIPNTTHPCLSTVHLPHQSLVKVEVLKNLSFVSLIMSPRLRVTHYRGKKIVEELVEMLRDQQVGARLLPRDFREVLDRVVTAERSRVVSDFIAGMTDRYALEFYGRLTSKTPATIFKPL